MRSISSERPRVLVADDEKVIADTLKLILAGVGYDVSAVYDGVEAVEKAAEWPPDLFLSDVFMPGLSGIEAAIQICKRLPECKVLLMSGQASLEDMHDEIKFTCRRFETFLKPIHPTELIAHVRAML